ncbi:putative nuclease HARBI1 [Gigantopelta aegis]|uniref:putative nuclease HARBI1 n=1 Tax=Gigantopelta aegis TaxID=1735272 RepID=UPI001B887ABD|nr:putative nuclease HARBI1 [Gigantopelta aegis]
MVTLRYFASGSFQAVNADVHGMHRMSISRSIHSVSKALCNNINKYIKFTPQNDLRSVKQGFYDIAKFPNVVGTIDGTLIPIKCPSNNDELYVCRKGYHAINVQVINDHRLICTDIMTKWPGGTHDSFMWNNSAIQERFASGEFGDSWLLGDSGYPCLPFLLTPVLNPQTGGQRNYNQSQRKTRNASERAIGVWKMRFLCLHAFGGFLMYSPEKCVNIIAATAILHNICRQKGIPLMDYQIHENEDDDDNNHYQIVLQNQRGIDLKMGLKPCLNDKICAKKYSEKYSKNSQQQRMAAFGSYYSKISVAYALI